MDGYLAVVSKREVRDYADRPIPDDELVRILQAGRATGSSKNRQPWRFVMITERAQLDDVAEVVMAPENLQRCVAAIAIVMPTPDRGFDAGRVAQNMMVAAWSDGVGSCPNSARDQTRALELLEAPADHHVATILSLGYPRHPSRLRGQSAAEVLATVDRKPLDELVRWA